MGEKIAANTLGKALQQTTSLGAEFGTLMVAEQGISLLFEQQLTPITMESAIQSLGMILGLRAY